MPCFSAPPSPDTPEYQDWLPGVQKKLDAFAHMVDFYYRKAGFPMPQPSTVENMRNWFVGGRQLPPDVAIPVDAEQNKGVLRQILLHLDCDGVDVFQLHDVGNLLIMELTPQRIGYAFVLDYCFIAMRNHAI